MFTNCFWLAKNAKITNTMISLYLPIYHLSSINSSFHLSVYLYTILYSTWQSYSGCILTVRSDSWLKLFSGWCGKKGGVLPHSHSCPGRYSCTKHGHLTKVRANCEWVCVWVSVRVSECARVYACVYTGSNIYGFQCALCALARYMYVLPYKTTISACRLPNMKSKKLLASPGGHTPEKWYTIFFINKRKLFVVTIVCSSNYCL